MINTITCRSNAFADCYDLDDIIVTINSNSAPARAKLAGRYAHECACDHADGDVVDAATIEAHIDYIAECGARFDYAAALRHGMRIIAQYAREGQS